MEKNIFVLSTDKPSRLHVTLKAPDDYDHHNKSLNVDRSKWILYDKPKGSGKRIFARNIYITSNEEIKEGDWYYLPKENKFAKCPKTLKLYSVTPQWTQKIILTNNEDLIKDGVQPISDEFLKWFCDNSQLEFVEVQKVKDVTDRAWYNTILCRSIYKTIIQKEELKTSEEWQKQYSQVTVLDPDGWDRKNFQYSWFEEKITYGEYNLRLSRSTAIRQNPKEELERGITITHTGKTFEDSIKRVDSEIEEMSNDWDTMSQQTGSKQQTLEEASKDYIENTMKFSFNSLETKTQANRMLKCAEFGAKWQQERSYSEEEVKHLIHQACHHSGVYIFHGFEKWFKRFKKK